MKKILTLLLLFVGMVSTASATDYIISGNRAILNGNHTSDYWWEDPDNTLIETTTSGIYTLVVENCHLIAGTDYGFKVKVYENAWNDNTTFPGNPYEISVPYDGNYTIIYFVDIANKNIRVIATPMLRNSLANNWDKVYQPEYNLTKNGDFTWTFELSGDDFTNDFSFRLFSAVFSKSAYPNGQDIAVSYGGDAVSSAYFNTPSSTNWSWKLVKPSYDFDKVVITAVYNPFANNDFGTWEVSADAYVPVTMNVYGMRTFSHVAPLDFTKVDGIDAYKGIVNNGSVICTKLAQAVTANTGVFLAGTANTTFSVPVAYNPADFSTFNEFVAILSSETIAPTTTDNKTNLILVKVNAGTADEGLGFRQFSNAFTPTAAQLNTAYLSTSGSLVYTPGAGSSKEYLDIVFGEQEVTAISGIRTNATVAKGVYNLQGQYLGTNTEILPRGIYVVNGKKVVIK